MANSAAPPSPSGADANLNRMGGQPHRSGSVSTPRHVIVTATVAPQISQVVLKDRSVRLEQYLQSLAMLQRNRGVSRVTVIENSGHDFSLSASKVLGDIPNDFVCYEDRRKDISIGALEARMYREFLNRHPRIEGEIIKITGRYHIKNFDRIFSTYGNLAFSFRPTLGVKKAHAVLTSTYKMEAKEFQSWSEFVERRDLSVDPLEMHLAAFIRSRNPRSAAIRYPHISGYSGTFGTSYAANYKELARILMSGMLPFGFRWNTPI